PQKQPPARIATSDVARTSAGSLSTGGGIERALSAADEIPRKQTTAPSSATIISARRGKSDACRMRRLPAANLHETDDRMRYVRLLQRGNLVCGKFHVHRCESIVEMVQFRGANDRSCDDRLRKQPRQSYLCPRDAAPQRLLQRDRRPFGPPPQIS